MQVLPVSGEKKIVVESCKTLGLRQMNSTFRDLLEAYTDI